MRYSLLAIDLDGTLLMSLTGVSERNRQALLRAEQEGCRVAICTARGRFTTRPVLEELGAVSGPHILFNGAARFASLEAEPEEVLTLQPDEVAECVEVAAALGLGLSGFEDPRLGDMVYLARPTPGLDLWAQQNGMRTVWVDGPADILARRLVAFVFWGTEAQARELHGALGPRTGLSAPRLGFSRNLESYLVELTAEGATKAEALARLAQSVGVPRESVVAVGDAPPDAGMLEYAGLGVAVGNAADEVKAAADVVVSACEEDAVADVVERFILGG